MLEVLTPAPGAEALIAAVQSGADAVCIRFGGAGARGFTQSEFARSVRYCRVRGCRVYAELDTLVADSEMAAAADFVRSACEAGVDAVIAEDWGFIAAARAVAPLNVLAEYLLPYVRVGGRMLCWKGPAVREEMAAGERACKMLGGQAEGLYRLPIEGREHYVHSAIKISATARRYPRKSGTPSKDPLGILPQKP